MRVSAVTKQQTDEFRQHALFVAVACIRAAASPVANGITAPRSNGLDTLTRYLLRAAGLVSGNDVPARPM